MRVISDMHFEILNPYSKYMLWLFLNKEDVRRSTVSVEKGDLLEYAGRLMHVQSSQIGLFLNHLTQNVLVSLTE